METGEVQESWVRISWCYQQSRVVQAPKTSEELDGVSTEREELYLNRLTEGLRFRILVRQYDIEDGIPTESEVETEVKGLKGFRAGDLSGMRA